MVSMVRTNVRVRDINAAAAKCFSIHSTRNVCPAASLSAFNGNNVSLDLAIDGALAEPPGDSFRRNVGRSAQPRGIAGLDFIP
jgi:hypothetical protein